ncbi:MAG TPA: IS66 family insertion sequence element accessory protein TnpB [Oligoflexia bacterium]|nr:IS66 family insertion sequence element accessory protein TnpB [Oligoflexia bacterium]
MIELSNWTNIFLFTRATDMRKGFDQLAEVVRVQLKRSVIEGGLFVFFSRKRDRVKVLFWDRDGYAIFYKRLEAGVFRVEEKDGVEEVTAVDLKLLLEGMDLSRIKLRQAAQNGLFTQAAA